MHFFSRLLVRPGVLAGLLAMLYLVSAAWIKADRLWQWKAALLAQEFGHWFALVSVLLALAAWTAFTGWHRNVLCLLGLALAAAHMVPAIGAARLTPGFDWARLWTPWRTFHAEVVTERKVFWKQGDDSLDLIACRPVTAASARPWVLVVHGGGWDGGTADEFAEWNQELASHGLVVLTMNYRLAPKDRWPAQRDDVRHAVEWARAHAQELGLDPAKLIMMGRSAGGQIASACAYGQPDLKVARCILFYSPMDMVFARKYAYAEDILNSLSLLRKYLGGDPEQVPEAYHTSSAINYVTPAAPPTLLMHGTNDSLVWVKQSRRFAQRLEEAGVKHRFIELPWATHGCDYFPSTPEGQLSMHAVLEFIAEL
ncbi:MAG: nlhH 3 [Verrucomicrobiaceae bacterium]|nr:nlhH 3 [Verrucomicrobiaceae bacterium]